ncbi:MAG: hypothetical protein ACTTJG_01475 [Treponema sp.]
MDKIEKRRKTAIKIEEIVFSFRVFLICEKTKSHKKHRMIFKV